MSPRQLAITDLIFTSTEPEQALLQACGGGRLVVSPSADEATLIEACRDADAVLTCFAQVSAAVLAQARRCRIVVRYGTGVDTIDVAEATRRGILVCNVPEYCTDEVAEHTLALMLACARRLPRAARRLEQGERWSIDLVRPLHSLGSATVGLIGFGKIARAVCARLRPFGAKVLVYARGDRRGEIERAGAEPAPLDTLLALSDYISLHVPLTAETRHLIGTAELARLKPTAYLINTARGGLVDADALVDALGAGRLAGAALDVMPSEPPPADHPLLHLENVVVTPHAAFYTEESLDRLQKLAVEQLRQFWRGERPTALVNPAAWR
ncbi:MAG TPA: C-terminal binding protein [Limnochordia bacterium]|nr:C-terminal binding protein [Limnochordia bacterium]